MSEGSAICPGCGIVLPSLGYPLETGYNATGECRGLFDELSVYSLLAGQSFIHQHVVDAYGASHVGPSTKPIMATFTLAGLYLLLERGYTGREVQLAHMKMAKAGKDWPRFEQPLSKPSICVADVLAAEAGRQRNAAILTWSRSVWEVWSGEHARVRQTTGKLLSG